METLSTDITKVDVLRVLRERLDSIITGLDDHIAHSGEAGHPTLLNAGTVWVRGRNEHGYVLVHCQDWHCVVDAEFAISIEAARAYGLLEGDQPTDPEERIMNDDHTGPPTTTRPEVLAAFRESARIEKQLAADRAGELIAAGGNPQLVGELSRAARLAGWKTLLADLVGDGQLIGDGDELDVCWYGVDAYMPIGVE